MRILVLLGRVNVYLPDEVQRLAMAEDLNLSGLLRAAVLESLGERDSCAHERVRCSTCSVELPGPGSKGRKAG